MNQMELSKKLGISQGWLWKIYHGYGTPGRLVAKKLELATGKPVQWWVNAKVSQIQKVLDAISNQDGREMRQKARVVPIESEDGTLYVLVYDGRPRTEFRTVTEAQIFCLSNGIPFEPWR